MFCAGSRAGVGTLGQKLQHRVLAEASALDQLERVDIDLFLLDAGRLRAHRARRDAADIGVVSARRDEEQDLGATLGEHRRDHRNVGEMRAAVIGRVEHPNVAGFKLGADLAPYRLDATVHGTEMHRDMRRVGDEAPFAVEDGAGKSSRSLMLTERAVFCSAYPICSAMAVKRLLNTSSSTGSTLACRGAVQRLALRRRA